MKYFNNPETLEELKKQYKKLAMENHPDRGGNTEKMKAINGEYDELFKILKNVHKSAEGKTYTAENSETPEEFKNIIEKIIIFEGIEIEIIGSWIWITGNTYQYKENLKELNFRFSNSKKAWYYHGEGYSRRGRKTYSLDEIRSLYGSEKITSEPQLKLTIV